MKRPPQETVDEWVRRVAADLDHVCRDVRNWRGVVVRLAVLVDAVDRLVEDGADLPGITGPLRQAREAVVAGCDRVGFYTGEAVEDSLEDDQRSAVVRVCNRYWEGPGYVPAIILDERARRRWRDRR